MIVKAKLDCSYRWSHPNVYVFTGSPVTKLDGSLVMAAGAALEISKANPGASKQLGALVSGNPGTGLELKDIGFNQWVGWMKVRKHWANRPDVEIIRESTAQLASIARLHSGIIFHCAYPKTSVKEQAVINTILDELPNNVIFYVS